MHSYFPNLDGLRFIGFLFIFFSHCFLGTTGLGDDVNYLGFIGLDFFFVLSSFLITFTLLGERSEKGVLNFGNYFWRRSLRIWPLYLVIVGMGFGGKLILERWGVETEELPPLWTYLSFTTNFWIINHGTYFLFLMVFLWSICVEEQFYLVWGATIKFLHEHLIKAATALIFVSLFFRWYYREESPQLMFNTLSFLGNFGVGAILAWACFYKTELFDNLRALKRSTWFLVYIVLILNLVFYHKLYDSGLGVVFEQFFLSVLFALVIFDQCFNEKPFYNAGKWKLLRYLGKISYGLYMFHGIVITLILRSTYWFGDAEEDLTIYLWRPLLILFLSIGLAAISYSFFEKPFLRLKTRF